MDEYEKENRKHDKSSLFVRVPKRAFFDNSLSKKDLLVLASICSFINSKTDSFHMSRPKIAERAGYDKVRRIDESIKNLEVMGYIKVLTGGKGRENTYTVLFADPIVAANPAPATTKPILKLAPPPRSVTRVLDGNTGGRVSNKSLPAPNQPAEVEPGEKRKSSVSIGGDDEYIYIKKKKSTPNDGNVKST